MYECLDLDRIRLMNVMSCRVACSRNLLGLKPSEQLNQLSSSDLAKLIYRDNIAVKHSSRKRLAEEVASKMPETTLAVQEKQSSKPGAGGPLTRALKDYLLYVSCPGFEIGCNQRAIDEGVASHKR